MPYSLYNKCLELEEFEAASGSLGLDGMRRLRGLYERAIRDYGDRHTGGFYVMLVTHSYQWTLLRPITQSRRYTYMKGLRKLPFDVAT